MKLMKQDMYVCVYVRMYVCLYSVDMRSFYDNICTLYGLVGFICFASFFYSLLIEVKSVYT